MVCAILSPDAKGSIITNSEFATRIGCDTTTVSRWRNGHRLPGVEYLERIRVEFGFTHEEVKIAWEGGKKSWGKFVRTRIFLERR